MLRISNVLEHHLRVHAIRVCVGQTKPKNDFADVRAGFFGKALQQVHSVCLWLYQEYRNLLHQGFVGLGFSQGGLLLRALLQECEIVPMRALVTLGSPHAGIATLPTCPQKPDDGAAGICRAASAIAAAGVYSHFVQSTLVPAQYFKDPHHLYQYYNHALLLPRVNCERSVPSSSDCPAVYKQRLQRLLRLSLFRFSHDTVLVPRDSAHFVSFNATATYIPLTQMPTLRDGLGLGFLMQNRRIRFFDAPFEHMQFTEDFFVDAVIPELRIRANASF